MPSIGFRIHAHFDNQFVVNRGVVCHRLTTPFRVTAIVLSILIGIPTFGILSLPVFYVSTAVFRQFPFCYGWYAPPVVNMVRMRYGQAHRVVVNPLPNPHRRPAGGFFRRNNPVPVPVRHARPNCRQPGREPMPVHHPLRPGQGIPARRVVR